MTFSCTPTVLHSVVPSEVRTSTLVTAPVPAPTLPSSTGHFPGSPAMINFAFRLNGDQITNLEIAA